SSPPMRPIRTWCSDESNRSRPPEGGHSRPAGRRRRELASPARVRGRRGAGRACGRPRARRRRSGRRPGAARADVRPAARESVDRELRDRRRGHVTEPAPRIGIVTFPGSNDDRDAAWSLRALGAEPVPVWHAESELPDVAAVVLPGGFSYGDYLRCGAIARFSSAMEGVVRFATGGGLVLGICNGFQILCEAGLLPGVLRPNVSLSFVCRDVRVAVERSDTPFTARCVVGPTLTVPVKPGRGC